MASSNNDNTTYQQDSTNYLSGISTKLTGYTSLLRQLGADKGLEFYSRQDSLETTVKNVINAVKDALSAVTVLVYRLPILGSILGPRKWHGISNFSQLHHR